MTAGKGWPGTPQGRPAGPGREAEEPAVDGEAVPEPDDDRNLTPSEEGSGPATDAKGPGGANGADGVRATPVARRVAKELGVDLGGVTGSGPGTKVTKEDVIAAADGGGNGAAPAVAATAGDVK